MELATTTFECFNPECDNEFTAQIIEYKKRPNHEGSWIVKCETCDEIFDLYMGEDINDSSLISGGQILGRYNHEFYSDDGIDDEVRKFRNIAGSRKRREFFNESHVMSIVMSWPSLSN
jgi:hypothetical protein